MGALIAAEAAPVAKVMPPLPSVSVPNVPWLIVAAPVPLASNDSPSTEKFWPSVVTNGVALALVAEKWTLFVAFGAKSASGVPPAA